jgi:hypothetical protein
MSALLKEQFILTVPDTVESLDAAIEELTRLYVEADARRGQLGRRLREVQSGAVEVRRRHARNALDAFLPPLSITSFERAAAEPAPPPTLRCALSLLFEALDDVLRIWWGRQLMRWWRAR